MLCEFCGNEATEKHHITYYPEQTIGVCGYHGDDIHKNPWKYPDYIKYKKGDADTFYSQKERISRFLGNLARRRHKL